MTTGMVYLRPERLLRFRAVGPFSKAVPEAWKAAFDWLDASGLKNEIHKGYGMARGARARDGANRNVSKAAESVYDACLPVPASLPDEATFDLAFCQLPGGAYSRCRHTGAYETIPEIFRDMREGLRASIGLEPDLNRPLIEIYLRDPRTTSIEQLKADLLMPVAFAASHGRNAA